MQDSGLKNKFHTICVAADMGRNERDYERDKQQVEIIFIRRNSHIMFCRMWGY